MQTRSFSHPPVPLSTLGIGCSRIGSFGNATPLAEIRRMLARALELGVTVFDTANIYGQGDSERELGRLAAGRRDKLFIVTKVGQRFSGRMRLLRPVKPILAPILKSLPSVRSGITATRQSHIGSDFSAERIEPEVEASLRRLRTETIDGLLLHSPPAEAIRKPEIAQTLERLQRSGKVRFFGVSCDDHECLEAALAIPGLSLLQLPLDVLDQAAASGLGRQIEDRAIGVFAREAIKLRPDLSPPAAVAATAARQDVTSVVVGLSTRAHLDGISARLS